MKKLIALTTSIIVIASSLIGCTDNSTTTTPSTTNNSTVSDTNSQENSSEKINIICTIFPVYDWVKEIVGDNPKIDVTFLCDSGIDLHNYQPTIQDIITIQESDLFVYIGGDSDVWVNDVLDNSITSMNLIDVLGDSAVFEEFVEGMQAHDHDDHDDHEEHDHEEHDHEDHDHEDHDHEDHDHEEHDHEDHDHAEDDHAEDDHAEDDHEEHDHEDHDHEDHDHAEDEHDDHDHSHDEIYDEHIWLSLRNASILVEEISKQLSSMLPDYQEEFSVNVEAYQTKLSEIDSQYIQMVEGANRDTILVADRFALRYIVEDYDLDYFAAFSGCHADAEVSFETMKFLTDKVGELDLDYIMIIEGSDGKLAQTISEGHEVEDIITFNSMQSITQAEVSNGLSYLDIMETNLEVLTKALS